MKNIFLILAFVLPFVVVSQTMNLRLDGVITNIDLGKKEAGVTVAIVQEGKTIGTSTSASNGKYSVKADVVIAKPFELVASKAGFVTKKIAFNFSALNPEDLNAGEFRPMEPPIEIFAERPGVDFSFLNTQPVGKVVWDGKAGIWNIDQAYGKTMADKIEKLLKQADANKQQNDLNYNKLITEADKFYNTKNYEAALSKYEEAVKIPGKGAEAHPNNRIVDLMGIIQKQREADLQYKQDNAKYLKIIAEADAAFKAGDLDKAKDKYNEALDVDDDQEYPRQQITKINAAKKEKENRAKYDQLMEAAEIQFKQKDYKTAKANFEQASKLITSEQLPITRMADCDKMLNEEADKLAAKAKLDEAVAKADELFKNEKWAEAKTAYIAVLDIDKMHAHAKAQNVIIDKRLADLKAQEEKLEKINNFIKEGDLAMTDSQFEAAKAKFNEAIKLDNTHEIANARLKAVQEKIDALASEKQLNDKIAALVKAGDDLVASNKFEDAIKKYEEAQALKKSEAVTAKIDIARDGLNKLKNQKELDEKFAKHLADGNAALQAKDYSKAIEQYNEALKIRDNDATASAKLADAKKALNDLEIAQNKQKQIEKLIQEGTEMMEGGVMDAPNLSGARLKFVEVQGLDKDNAVAKDKIAQIDKLIATQKENADKQAKFSDAVKKGDEEFAKSEWAKAIGYYDTALKLIDDSEVKTKKANAETSLANSLNAKKLEEDYAIAIKDGKALLDTKKYDEAYAKYKIASDLKPNESFPREQMQAIVDLQNQLKNQAEKVAKVNQLLSEGEMALTSKDLATAEAKFKEVLSLDEANDKATKRIKDIALEKEKLQGEEAKKIKIETLVAEGKSAFDTKNYADSKVKFIEVQGLQKDNATAIDYLARIATIEQQEKLQGEKEQRFNQHLNAGETALNAGKLQEALDSFNKALEIKNEDATAMQKKEHMIQLIKAKEEEAKLNADYQVLIKAADQLRDKEDFSNALTKYTEASNLKKDENYPKVEIEKINQLIKERTSKEQLAQEIDRLLKEGTDYFNNDALADAKTAFNKVLGIEKSNKIALEKIAQIESKEKELANAQNKLNAFKDFKNKGITAFKANDHSSAKSQFDQALLIQDDAEIRDYLKQIEAAKNETDQLKQEITSFLAQAKNATDKKEWENAMNLYNEVLKRDNNNAIANAQISFIRNEQIKEQSNALKLENFNKWKATGLADMANKDWDKAKHSLETALTYKENDAEAIKLLNEVKEQLSAIQQKRAKEKQYQDAIDKGDLEMAAKNFSAALASYKTASQLFENEQYPKKQIELINKLQADQQALSAIDKKFNDLIEAGDRLVDEKRYTEAIQKYNGALDIKPNDKLPVTKAATAERLAQEQKNSEIDEAFNRLINAIGNKIAENDLETAKNYISNAKQLRPDDPRPDALTAKIAQIEKDNADYKKYMAMGAEEEKAKNYPNAITQYMKAQTVKPDKNEPEERIQALRAIMQTENSALENEKAYQNYLDAGIKKIASQEYDLAISNLEKALQYKKNDPEALKNKKIAESLLEEFNRTKNASMQLDAKYNALVNDADNLFKAGEYQKSIDKYNEALEVKENSTYPTQQIAEAKRLIQLQAKEKDNVAYQKLIADADVFLRDKDYLRAKELYQQAHNKRSYDNYPATKLQEIEAILNPITLRSDELEELGDPFDGSLLEAEQLLKQAELKRKNIKRLKIIESQEKTRLSNSQLADNKNAELGNTINSIYNLYTSIYENDQVKDMEKIVVNAQIGTNYKKAIEINQANTNYENFSIAETEQQIRAQESVIASNYRESIDLQIENHKVVNQVRLDNDQTHVNRSQSSKDLNLSMDRNLTDLQISISDSSLENDQDLFAIQKEVDINRESAQSKAAVLTDNNYDESVVAKEQVEKIYSEVSDKNAKATELTKENNQLLVKVQQDIVERSESASLTNKNEAINKDAQMKEVKEKVVENATQKEVARIESNDKIKENTANVINAEAAKKEANADRSIETKELIETQDIKRQAMNDVAKVDHEAKVTSVKVIEKSTSESSAQKSVSDTDERMATQRQINLEQQTNVQRNDLEQTRSIEKSEQVKEINKITQNNAASKQVEKNMQTEEIRKDLSKAGEKTEVKAIVPNSLGEKYPEGVSQEMFQRKDEAGLLVAIVTRRIVVIEGRGTEYVRTQTNHAITYTKDGQPTTEYVWQRETQNAKLQRHY